MRMVPGRYWAVAVCVCVKCIIFMIIYYCRIPDRTCTETLNQACARDARALARLHGLVPRTSRTDSYVQVCRIHTICAPRFPRPAFGSLTLSSRAELTPASVTRELPSARTHCKCNVEILWPWDAVGLSRDTHDRTAANSGVSSELSLISLAAVPAKVLSADSAGGGVTKPKDTCPTRATCPRTPSSRTRASALQIRNMQLQTH